MHIFEIILISIGLAMDAFAVSICKGFYFKNKSIKKSIIVASYFSLFQMIMPLIGYLLGIKFQSLIQNIDHYIAFILLSVIGINMIKEAEENNIIDDSINFKIMIILSIATSVDALAVGISFAFLSVNIIESIIFIGIITFIITFIGTLLGCKFKNVFGNKAEVIGGLILIFIGLKILFEHLYIL